MKNIRECYPLNTFTKVTQDEIIEFYNKRHERQIGAMRQWLNEDRITEPKKMITNEDLIYWLNL